MPSTHCSNALWCLMSLSYASLLKLWHRTRKTSPILLLFLLSGVPCPSWSAITDTGDVQVAGSDLFIGNSADGARVVDAITLDTHDNTGLGNAPGVTGDLVLNCGIFQNNQVMTVGNSGRGNFWLNGFNSWFAIPGCFSSLTASASSHSIVVGRQAGSIGNITLNINSSLQAQTVVLGELTDSLGIFTNLDGGLVDIGDTNSGGYLGAGISGKGNYADIQSAHFLSGPYGRTNVSGPGSAAEISVNPGSSGTLGFSYGSFTVSGLNSRLSIGVRGNGKLSLSDFIAANTFEYGAASVSVVDEINNNALMFIAQHPGSEGTVTLGGRSTLNAGNVLRIGLDENDGPGGTGSLIYNHRGPHVRAGLVKIGPAGEIKEVFRIMVPSTGQQSLLAADIINNGLINVFSVPIQGNLSNSGTVSLNSPGGAPLDISGDLVQTAAGTLALRLSSASSSTIETGFRVRGSAQIDGTFAITASSINEDATIRVLNSAGGATFTPGFNLILPTPPTDWIIAPLFDAAGLSIQFISPKADLGLILSGTPASVILGQNVTYTATITNGGPTTARNAGFNDNLPQGMLPVSASASTGTCSINSQQVTCSLGDLGSSDSATVTMIAMVEAIGSFSNSASVSTTTTDLNPANNSASVSTTVIDGADLSLVMMDSPDPVKKGAKLVYTLAVKNNGPSDATNVSLTDTLPANIVFEKVTTTQGSCSGTATVTCALGTLTSGATAKVTITIKPQTTGTITNSASVTATESDTNTGNNSAIAATLVKK